MNRFSIAVITLSRIQNKKCVLQVIALIVTAAAFSFSQGLNADKNLKAEETIKKLEFELAHLIMSGNFAKYATYLADDYLLTEPTGEVTTKEQILESFSSGATKGDSLFPSDLKVRVYNNDTAILNGHLLYKGHQRGLGAIHDAQFTKVFIKRKGKWLLVSNQGSPSIIH